MRTSSLATDVTASAVLSRCLAETPGSRCRASSVPGPARARGPLSSGSNCSKLLWRQMDLPVLRPLWAPRGHHLWS